MLKKLHSYKCLEFANELRKDFSAVLDWDFNKCDKCAMGLAAATGRSTGADIGSMANFLEIPNDDAWDIFEPGLDWDRKIGGESSFPRH